MNDGLLSVKKKKRNATNERKKLVLLLQNNFVNGIKLGNSSQEGTLCRTKIKIYWNNMLKWLW
jgi:hypothetical protein